MKLTQPEPHVFVMASFVDGNETESFLEMKIQNHSSNWSRTVIHYISEPRKKKIVKRCFRQILSRKYKNMHVGANIPENQRLSRPCSPD